MKNRSFSALLPGNVPSATASPRDRSFARYVFCGLLLAAATLGLTACHSNLFLAYKFPEYPFANRPVPPSKLAERVMISVGNAGLGGNTGVLAIVDAKRDIRSNIQNTQTSFSIGSYSAGVPSQIFNFPEQITGYVYSATSGSLTQINYGTETAGNVVGTFPSASGIAIPTDFGRFFGAQEVTGQLAVFDASTSKSYELNIPNVYRVASNTGGTVAIAMVRNSNDLYQIVKLNANQASPPNAVDCQPVNLPVYCAVKVPGSYDRPTGAYFSVDGTTAYILNCGAECGGTTSSVTLLQQGVLNINNYAQTGYSSGSASANGFIANIPVPGGATTALSDGTTLYVAGQQLQPDGLFAGNLSTIAIATNTITGQYSISDGSHSKILFGDDNTLWIGSQLCATGERAKLGQNYNCLTRFDLGAKTAAVIPNVTPGGATTVPYPNTNLNPYYYGDLTGLCWVQNYHKMYTAYGGQVHIFSTVDGSEIDNSLVTVQGTALDVAYMDATTNAAD